MKRILSTITMLLFIAIFVAALYVLPKRISLSLTGVEYQLGQGETVIHPVSLQIHGRLHGTWTGQRTFVGTISIEGARIPNPDNHHRLVIHFRPDGEGPMTYAYLDNGKPVTRTYGMMFASHNFRTLTIEEFSPQGKHKGWNSRNGFIISAPAQNRSEALRISNLLMKDTLHGFTLH